MFASIAKLVLRYRRASWALIVLLCALAGFGLTKLKVDFSFDQFMGSDDPMFQDVRKSRQKWGPDDTTLLIVVQAKQDLRNAKGIEKLSKIQSVIKKSESIKSVNGLPDFPRVEGGVTLEVSTLAESIASMSASENKAFFESKFIKGMLVSEDGKTTLFSALLDVESDDIFTVKPAIDKLRTNLLRAEKEFDVETSLAGIPAVRSELVQSILENQSVFITISGVFMLVTVLWLFRRFHGLTIPALAALVPTLWLLGLMGFVGEPFGILSQVYPALIPVIAVADAIHIIQRFHFLLEEHDHPSERSARRALIVEAIKHTGSACFFTSATTAIGFFSLFTAEMTVLYRFGLFAGIGVLGSFVCMIVLVPLCLDFVVKKPAPSRAQELNISRVTRWAIQRPKAVVLVALVMIAAVTLLGTRARVDNELDDSLVDNGMTARAHKVVDQELGGVISVQLELESESSLLEPKILSAIDEFETWVFEHETLKNALGPAAPLKELNKAFTGEAAVPNSAALSEQLLALSDENALNAMLSSDRKNARIIIAFPDVGGVAFEALDKEISRKAAALFEGHQVKSKNVGVVKVAYIGLNRLAGELAFSLLLAAFIITVLLFLVFRNLKLTLISVLPNLAPLSVSYGVMGALLWNFDPGSTVVFTVALGIAVDDTIHLLSRIKELSKTMSDSKEIIISAVETTGSAMFTTSLLLAVGFGVVGFSSFPITRVFGVLSAVAIVAAFLFDIIVLPALYVWVSGDAQSDK